MEKICKKCHTLKPLSDFYKHPVHKDGYENQCKACKHLARKKRSNEEGFKNVQRKSFLKRLYGITVEEYDAMLERQGGVCAICAGEETRGQRLAVDHCHATGKVRGLLCFSCNTTLGKFNDSQELLARAIKYLQEHQQ